MILGAMVTCPTRIRTRRGIRNESEYPYSKLRSRRNLTPYEPSFRIGPITYNMPTTFTYTPMSSGWAFVNSTGTIILNPREP